MYGIEISRQTTNLMRENMCKQKTTCNHNLTVLCLLMVYICLYTEEQFITDETIVAAREASEEDLLVVHTKCYLSRLKVFPCLCSSHYTLCHLLRNKRLLLQPS